MVTKTTSPPIDTAAALQAVEHTDDVVEYALRCVLALAPNLSQAVADAADRQVRELFGRSKVYVAARRGDGRSDRNASIRRDHQAGERLALLSRRYGLTERRILQILAAG